MQPGDLQTGDLDLGLTLSPRALLAPLLEQLGFVAVFVLSAVLTAFLLTYVYSERYETFSVLTFRPQEADANRVTPPQAFGSPVPAAPFKVIGQTLQELARSPELLSMVVAEFNLDDKTRVYEGPFWKVWLLQLKDQVREFAGDLLMYLKYGRVIEADPTIEAMKKLAKNVHIRSQDSYVFTVLVRDQFPLRAAAIADRIAEILVDQGRDEERRPGQLRREQLEQQLAEKSRALAEARTELDRVLTGNRLVSIDMETQQLIERRSKLLLEAAQLRAEIKRAEQRLAAVERKQAMKGTVSATGKLTLPANAEPIQPEDFQRLSTQKVFGDVELAGMRAELGELDVTIRAISARLDELPGIHRRIDELRLILTTLERDYARLADAHQDALLQATGLTSEISVQTVALVPYEPVSPIKLYHMVLAGMLSLFFSVGLVYVLTYFEVGKRTAEGIRGVDAPDDASDDSSSTAVTSNRHG